MSLSAPQPIAIQSAPVVSNGRSQLFLPCM